MKWHQWSTIYATTLCFFPSRYFCAHGYFGPARYSLLHISMNIDKYIPGGVKAERSGQAASRLG